MAELALSLTTTLELVTALLGSLVKAVSLVREDPVQDSRQGTGTNASCSLLLPLKTLFPRKRLSTGRLLED